MSEGPEAARKKYGVNDYLTAYIHLRDKEDEIKARMEAELAPIRENKTKLEAFFLKWLTENNVDHIAGEGGTVYRKTVSSAAVSNWEATLEYIRKHDFWHALTRSVSKAEVETIIEETGEPFPGVDLKTAVTVQFRRPTKKS